MRNLAAVAVLAAAAVAAPAPLTRMDPEVGPGEYTLDWGGERQRLTLRRDGGCLLRPRGVRAVVRGRWSYDPRTRVLRFRERHGTVTLTWRVRLDRRWRGVSDGECSTIAVGLRPRGR